MNNTLHVLNTNDETRKKVPDDVSELSVPDTLCDRQPHAHHIMSTPMEPLKLLGCFFQIF